MVTTLTRRAGLALAATALALTAALLPATPAQALTITTNDGFESNPASTWSIGGNGSGTRTGGFGTTLGAPRTGSNLTWLRVQNGTGWMSVGRTVSASTALAMPINCTLRFWLLSSTGSRANVEVIRPSDWTYLALNQVTASGSWQQFTAGPFDPSPAFTGGDIQMFVRVSLLGRGAGTDSRLRVDDMSFSCLY
jgi:hypothetical protein